MGSSDSVELIVGVSAALGRHHDGETVGGMGVLRWGWPSARKAHAIASTLQPPCDDVRRRFPGHKRGFPQAGFIQLCRFLIKPAHRFAVSR